LPSVRALGFHQDITRGFTWFGMLYLSKTIHGATKGLNA
jgi:hypothetical protein